MRLSCGVRQFCLLFTVLGLACSSFVVKLGETSIAEVTGHSSCTAQQFVAIEQLRTFSLVWLFTREDGMLLRFQTGRTPDRTLFWIARRQKGGDAVELYSDHDAFQERLDEIRLELSSAKWHLVDVSSIEM